LLLHGQNTVYVSYSLASGQDSVSLELRPSVHFRPHERDVSAPIEGDYILAIHGRRYEIAASGSQFPLRLTIDDDRGTFTYEGGRQCEIMYQLEADRGYASHGMLWSAGFFTVELRPHRPATLIASTEPWEKMLALKSGEAFAADAERR